MKEFLLLVLYILIIFIVLVFKAFFYALLISAFVFLFKQDEFLNTLYVSFISMFLILLSFSFLFSFNDFIKTYKDFKRKVLTNVKNR